MELISLKATEGIYPRYPYQRIQIAHWWEYFSFKIDYGFGYLMRRVRIKYPNRVRVPENVFTFMTKRWTALTAYSDTYIIPSSAYTGTHQKFFVYHTPAGAGSSGATEPLFWPTQPGATILDGTVTWTCLDPLSIPFYTLPSPKLRVEIFDNANDKVRQPEPQELDLITSPGSVQSFTSAAPAPVDNNGYGVNNSSNPPLFSPTLNFLYRYGDIIWLKFSGQTQQTSLDTPGGTIAGIPPFWTPDYIDIFIEGYYVPEKAFAMWKERKAV